MANPKKGDTVRQIVTPIQGVVQSYQVDQETGDTQCLIVWTCGDGHEHSCYLTAEELEVIPAE
jgi:hypothetical protein